jgi:arsenical pump membrane protein
MKRIPYPIIPFLLSMFIIIFALKTNGVITQFATYLSSCNMIIYGIIAYISCNLINNIPTAVLFTNLLSDSTYTIKYVYAVIASTNIGAYLTPIGALAGIMWMNILKKQELKFNFIQFIKYGILISLPTIIVTLIFIEIL